MSFNADCYLYNSYIGMIYVRYKAVLLKNKADSEVGLFFVVRGFLVGCFVARIAQKLGVRPWHPQFLWISLCMTT